MDQPQPPDAEYDEPMTLAPGYLAEVLGHVHRDAADGPWQDCDLCSTRFYVDTHPGYTDEDLLGLHWNATHYYRFVRQNPLTLAMHHAIAQSRELRTTPLTHG